MLLDLQHVKKDFLLVEILPMDQQKFALFFHTFVLIHEQSNLNIFFIHNVGSTLICLAL